MSILSNPDHSHFPQKMKKQISHKPTFDKKFQQSFHQKSKTTKQIPQNTDLTNFWNIDIYLYFVENTK